MPGFDRTGPIGSKPMTGGQRGYCNPAMRRRLPAGRLGFGRGFLAGRGFPAASGWTPPAGYNQDTAETNQISAAIDEMKAKINAMQETLEAFRRKVE